MEFTNAKLEETAKVFGAAIHGDHRARGIIKSVAETGLSEAISSSDLARTFAYVTNAAMMKQYAELPTTWTQFAKRDVFEDFKPKFQREFLFEDVIQLDENGGHRTAPHSLPVVPEMTEYPTFKWTTGSRNLSLHKTGARIGFSWEAVINDDWGLIAGLPGHLASFAKRTEETEAVKVLASATGPNADTFNVSNGNALGTTGVGGTRFKLSLNALEYAKREVRNREVNGRKINVSRFALIVPRAMEDVAKRVLSVGSLTVKSSELEYQTSATNSDVTLVVNDYLTLVDTSANAQTTWYLVPLNGTDGTRDTIVVNFLRNHESPELRQSGATGLYLGGGQVPSLEGSLLNDDIEYRIRYVVAGGYWFADAMYASTGESDAAAPDFLALPV